MRLNRTSRAFKWSATDRSPSPRDASWRWFWSHRLPTIRLTDELTGQTFSGPKGWKLKKASAHGGLYELPDSPIMVAQSFVTVKESNRWDFTITLPADAQFRSIRLEVVFPLPGGLDEAKKRRKWSCWAPGSNLPKPLSHISRQTFSYDHIFDHISVPMITFYDEENDLGITYHKPFDLKAPTLDYRVVNIPDFNIEQGYDLIVEQRHMALAPRGAAQAAVSFFLHEGDWRPALGHLADAFPDYFEPKMADPAGSDGPMLCGVFDAKRRSMTPAKIAKLAELDFTWDEVHAYFPFYGCYVPEEKEWWSCLKLEDPKGGTAVRTSRKVIHEHMAMLKKHGVKPYIYWQPGECLEEFAREKFPDSRLENIDGKPKLAYCVNDMKCVFMNYDLQTQWGQYILDQAKKLQEEFPEIAGLFVDNLVYRDCDFAMSDGVTAYQNRPCYKLTFAYDGIMTEVSKMFHARGKGLMCNGAINIEVARFIDGIMAETLPILLGYLQYLAVRKPIVLLDYDITESSMWSCLQVGAFPSLNIPAVPEVEPAPGKLRFAEKEALFRRYLPLFQPLRGRRWVLSAHPLTLPPHLTGNVFERPDGSYAITLLPVPPGVLSPEGLKDFDVLLRVKNIRWRQLTHAVGLRADDCSVNAYPVAISGDEVRVRVDWHQTAMTIVVGSKTIDTTDWTRFWQQGGAAPRKKRETVS